MNVLMRLTIRNLKLNRKRTIVSIIGIILSGAMICGVASLISSFQDLFIRVTIENSGNYHAVFTNVAYENIKYIEENANIKESFLIMDVGFAKLDKKSESMRPYLYVSAYDQTAFEHMPVKIKQGRLPQYADEIALSEQLASEKNGGYRIGQVITLPIGTRVDEGEILDKQYDVSDTEIFQQSGTVTYKVTGFLEKPVSELFTNSAYTAITYLDRNSVAASGNVNVSVLLSKPRSIYKTLPQIAETSGAEKVIYNNELLRWMGLSKNENYNNLLLTVGGIVIALVMIGSVTVIYNTFSISVNERKKQFGMLASVGATVKQIKHTVYFEGLILGLIGIPVGILSGILGIGATIKIINPLMESTLTTADVALRLIVSPASVLAAVLIAAMIIFISAYIPAKKASRITPIEAIRLNADIKVKGNKLRTSKLTRLLFGIEGELALKNLKRNNRRYRATVLSLFISIVLFVSFSTFLTLGFKSTEMYYADFDYNLSVQKYNAEDGELIRLFERIKELEDVEKYSIPRRISADAVVKAGEQSFYKPFIDINYARNGAAIEVYYIPFNIYTLNKEAYDQYLSDIGLSHDVLAGTDGIKAVLINKDKIRADKYKEYVPTNVSEGDHFRLKEIQYGENHEQAELDIEVAAVTDKFPFGLTYNNSINLIVSEESFESILPRLSEENRRDASYREMLIYSANPDRTAESIKEIDSRINDGTVSVYNVETLIRESKQQKLVISIFLYGFLTLITLIGVTNIFNTISTNIALRRREFAMLKSVGLTPRGFKKIINYESIFYGMKALLYGLPVSVLISLAMYNSFGNVFEFRLTLPWNSIFICIAGVFLVTFMTMLHSSRKLRDDNIVDALKEENL